MRRRPSVVSQGYWPVSNYPIMFSQDATVGTEVGYDEPIEGMSYCYKTLFRVKIPLVGELFLWKLTKAIIIDFDITEEFPSFKVGLNTTKYAYEMWL